MPRLRYQIISSALPLLTSLTVGTVELSKEQSNGLPLQK